MKIPSQKEFTEHIKDHLKVTGEKPSSFGRRVLGDSGAIPRLFEGTDPRLSTMQRILKAIEKAARNVTGT
jgi:predicted transcriptional regulator